MKTTRPQWRTRLAAGIGLLLCSAAAQALDIQPQVQAQLRISEPKAREFNQAMTVIANIAGKPLKDEKELVAANDLIRKQQLGVRHNFDQMVVIASASKEFVAGVQQAAEKEGADALAQRLKKDPGSVQKIAGAQPLLARLAAEEQKYLKTWSALQANLEQAQAAAEQACQEKAKQGGQSWKPDGGKTSSVPDASSLLQRPANLLLSSAGWLVDRLVSSAAAQDGRSSIGSRPISERDRQSQAVIVLIFLWLKQELKDAETPASGGPSPQQQCYAAADAASDRCAAGCPAAGRSSCRSACALGCNLNPFAFDKRACTDSCMAGALAATCTTIHYGACRSGCTASWTKAIAACLVTPQS